MNVDFEVSLEALEVDGTYVVALAGEVDLPAPPPQGGPAGCDRCGRQEDRDRHDGHRFIDSTTLGVILGASNGCGPGAESSCS